MKVLVTGATGFVGSHTLTLLIEQGFKVIALDNLSNSTKEPLHRIKKLTGVLPSFIQGDVRDAGLLKRLFEEHSIDAVLHFAGLKAVGESLSAPLRYFDNNVHGSLVLMQEMKRANVFRLVFSSSATVYGQPNSMPISETCPVGQLTNPYGRSKLMVEDILHDVVASDPRWRIAILRYFNPVGAHESGLIGEDPNGIPNNLLPYIAQVAVGKLPELAVFGADYPTPDGTGVRDYIHVVDLAEGHLKALEALKVHTGANVWNLGTGLGYSVLQMIRAFEAASGRQIPFRIASRRPGDIAICYADTAKAELEWEWKARRGLDQMMQDAWRWQSMNPNGFKS